MAAKAVVGATRLLAGPILFVVTLTIPVQDLSFEAKFVLSLAV
jgi:hypothetical protein